MNNSSRNARASFENCKGENLAYWVIQHGTGENIIYVTVDQNTIDSCTADFYHRVVDSLQSGSDYESQQFNNFIEDLSRSFKNLPNDAQKLILKEKNRDWDSIRIFAMSELTKKLRDIDPGELKHSDVDECLALYALLASAPVSKLFDSEGSVIFRSCVLFVRRR